MWDFFRERRSSHKLNEAGSEAAMGTSPAGSSIASGSLPPVPPSAGAGRSLGGRAQGSALTPTRLRGMHASLPARGTVRCGW
jgi:hypothetical protein